VANPAAESCFHAEDGLRQDGRKLPIKTTQNLGACSINCEIKVYPIAFTLCSTSWTKHWRDPALPGFSGQKTIMDGDCGLGRQCQVEFDHE
jgi:hypothetical protein